MIRKQTKETAETFGLLDRGQIKEGYLADINIIDHEKLCVYKPEMVHDLPTGNGENNPKQEIILQLLKVE